MAYLKRCNQNASDKPVGVAFYGRVMQEDDQKYYFLYGATLLDTVCKDVTHLSQAQRQEIEKIRGFHFREYDFIGYKMLDGTPVEGIMIYEQNIGRYISGYATFAEKNDCMLNFMMDHETEEVKPEVVDESKYKEVRGRQEQRREEAYYHYKCKKEGMGAGLKVAALLGAAVFGFVVYQNMDKPGVEQYLQKGGELVDQVKTQVETFLDTDEMTPVSVNSNEVVVETRQKDILVVEEELEEALIQENETEETREEESLQEVTTIAIEQSIESVEIVEPQESEAPIVQEPVVYVVQKGDTLISISTLYYGNKDRVEDICQLNHITNPDAIQEGWKIFLP